MFNDIPTPKQAAVSLRLARERLIEYVAEKMPTADVKPDDTQVYKDLATLTNNIAEAEGAYSGSLYAEQIAEATDEPQRTSLLAEFMRQAMTSDDTWSGRRNDVRRAYLDGFQDVAKRVAEDEKFRARQAAAS